MKINWTADWNTDGIALGYSTHQKMLRAALSKAGVEITPRARVAVHLVTPQVYQPIGRGRDCLYSMYEMQTLPEHWIKPLNDCDLLIVPCSHNKGLFEKYVDPALGRNPEVVVVTEGVDTEIYTEVAREFPRPPVPFRFLWVGASNARKGYIQTIQAWKLWRDVHPELIPRTELYMKTTQSFTHDRIIGYQEGKPVYKPMPRQRIFKADNSIVDTRKLDFTTGGLPETAPPPGPKQFRVFPRSMQELYHDAHAFLFPTMGEGFGLTLAEAMATGLPVIYTPWSGPVDFCDERTGYPLQYGWTKVKTVKLNDGGTEHESWSANPTIESIVARMEEVYFAYDSALRRGRAAAERIQEGFTWQISAQKLIKVLREKFGTECDQELEDASSIAS